MAYEEDLRVLHIVYYINNVWGLHFASFLAIFWHFHVILIFFTRL